MIENGNLPNLLLAGAPKCGTTSVYDWLVHHPEITGGVDKELFYLMDKNDWKFDKKANWESGGDEQYQKFFPNSNKYLVDGTTLTMYQKSALEYASRHKPKVLIYIRKPSARIYSTFKYFRDTRTILPKHETFKTFIDRVNSGDDFGGVNQLSQVIEQSLYSKYIERWIQVVGANNVKVLAFESLIQDKPTAMKDVCSWLQLDGSIFENFDFSHKNETSKIRFRGLNIVKESIAKQVKNKKIKDLIRPVYDTLNKSKSTTEKSNLELEVLKSLDLMFIEEMSKVNDIMKKIG